MADQQPNPAELLERIERLEAVVAQLTAAQRVTIPPPAAHPSIPAAKTLPAPMPLHTATPVPTIALPQVNPSRKPSLESEFGARVLSKIAVVLLLIGAAWFLKWAFDNRWIGPLGRVIAGLVAGAGVMLWSERFRRQGLNAFSYALKAVGSGVLYLSLWAGFQVYHLMPASVALLAMVAVTAANATLALTQDAELLAGFALLGGYLTPILLSTGGNHEVFLFSYLFVFAAATLALLVAKPWSRLLLGVFPFTIVYFIAWYAQHFTAADANLTLFFALLLWAPFAAVPLLAHEADDIIPVVLMPLAAAAFGALAVYSVLADSNGRNMEPWGAVVFAAVYLAFTRVRRTGVASAMHLSLAIVFLTIAIPLKATGRAISVGWLVESIALLWLATRDNESDTPNARQTSSAFRWLACASLILGAISALVSPYINSNTSTHAFFNRDFTIALGALAALSAAIYFASKLPAGVYPDGRTIAVASLILLNIVLLIAMYREIALYFHSQAPVAAWETAREQADFAFSGWMMLQGAALMVAGFWRRLALTRWLGLTLLAATVIKAFAYDMRNLGTGYRVISYLGLGILLMAVSFAYQKDWLGLRDASDEATQ